MKLSAATKETWRTLPHPTDPLEWVCYQFAEKALEKVWDVDFLKRKENDQGVIEIQVKNAANHKFLVEVVKTQTKKNGDLRVIYQCSCEKFYREQANMCEHVAILSMAFNRPRDILGGLEFYAAFKDKLSESRNYPLYYMIYLGQSDRFLTIKRGEKDSPLFLGNPRESVTVPDTLSLVTSKESDKYAEFNPEEFDKKIDSSGLFLNNIELYDYQKDIFQGLIKEKRAICSMPIGSGKTLTTLAVYAWLRRNYRESLKVLIICPASLKLQWQRELKRAVGVDSFCVDSAKKIEEIGKNGTNVDITTYQLFSRHHEHFCSQNYDFVVQDEIQYVRNEESAIWRAASKLNSQFFYGLSGTIIENKLDDLYSILSVIDPDFLGPKWKFSTKYQEVLSISKKVLKFGGQKNVEELRAKIAPKVFGYIPPQKLQPIIDDFVPVDMSHSQRSVHDSNEAQAKILLAKSFTNGLSFAEKNMLQSYLLKQRQACTSETLITKEPSPPSPKLIKLKEIVDKEINNGKKIVIFSQWTESLDLIKNLVCLPDNYVFYTGRENEKKRSKNLEMFKTNKNVNLFLASDSGGVGVDGLQEVSNVVIHMEPPWNPAKIDQRNGRLHRIGQKEQVKVYYLYASSSIEEELLEILKTKREIRNSTLY